jgi:hypothetical protein
MGTSNDLRLCSIALTIIYSCKRPQFAKHVCRFEAKTIWDRPNQPSDHMVATSPVKSRHELCGSTHVHFNA